MKRILLISFVAALPFPLPVLAQVDPGIVEDKAAKIQRAAQQTQSLENWFGSMATWEQQLNTMLESQDWLSKTYGAAQFIGASQQTMGLLNDITNYKNLVESVVRDIEGYGEKGLLSFEQLRYTSSLLTQGLGYVSGTLSENFKEALLSNGMTVAQRLELLCGTSEKLKREYWKLLLAHKRNKEKAAAAARSMSSRDAATLLGLSPTEPPKLNIDDDGFEAVLNDAKVAEICDRMARMQARYYGKGDIVEKAASEGRSHGKGMIAIASYLIGIAAALLLVIAFERRNKGERQSNDALYKIGIGLLFALVALQIVSKHFSF